MGQTLDGVPGIIAGEPGNGIDLKSIQARMKQGRELVGALREVMEPAKNRDTQESMLRVKGQEPSEIGLIDTPEEKFKLMVLVARLAQLLYELWTTFRSKSASLSAATANSLMEGLTQMAKPLSELGFKQFMPEALAKMV